MPRRSSGGLEDGGTSSSKDKRARVNWSVEENNLLINAWLSISKDSIHVIDPKLESYWKRITGYYNENREDMPPRVPKQLKDHWLKMKQAVCKFDGCYNRILKRKQSRCSEESQIITEAHTLYKSVDGKSFTMEYVWRLLKDEPRWKDVVEEYCSKRTKVSESGAYTSSSNMETPTSPDTSAPPLDFPMDQKAYASSSNMEAPAGPDKGAPPLECPMGNKEYTSSSNMQTPVSPDKSTPPLECPVDQQKAAKSKSKAVEEAELGSAISRFEEMHETAERKVAALEQLGLAKQEEARAKQEEARAKQEEARAKQEEARAKQEEARAMAEEARAKQQVLEYEILMKDTSQMTEAQQRDHNRICELIRQKLFGV